MTSKAPSAVLYQITLHLARSREFPNGAANVGYDIIAPLDPDGHLDAAAWKTQRERCEVVRFKGAEERRGKLVHKHGGAGGATWAIDYDATTDADDEDGYRLGTHRFTVGEYVSIRDEDDEMHTFRVVDVAPLD
jgi:hypothetical protein